MSEPPPRRRRWFSISLRGLMLLILVIGVTLGYKARRASLQRRGVARIAELSGSVVYDWQYAGSIYLINPATNPPAPAWLRQIVGDAYFQEVAVVNLPQDMGYGLKLGQGPDAHEKWARAYRELDERVVKALADDQLACLEPFDRLEALNLQKNYALDSSGLARLERWTRLKELYLSVNLDQAGLKRLGSLTRLKNLTFPIPDQGETDLSFLDQMPKLQSLMISGSALTDDHLKPIGRLPELEFLSVSGERLTDAGLASLQDARRLKYLWIMNGRQLTSDGLAALEGLTDLNTVFLRGFPITKAGLDHLRKLPKLISLSCPQSQIDAATLNEFKADRPGVTVILIP